MCSAATVAEQHTKTAMLIRQEELLLLSSSSKCPVPFFGPPAPPPLPAPANAWQASTARPVDNRVMGRAVCACSQAQLSKRGQHTLTGPPESTATSSCKTKVLCTERRWWLSCAQYCDSTHRHPRCKSMHLIPSCKHKRLQSQLPDHARENHRLPIITLHFIKHFPCVVL